MVNTASTLFKNKKNIPDEINNKFAGKKVKQASFVKVNCALFWSFALQFCFKQNFVQLSITAFNTLTQMKVSIVSHSV